MVLHAHNPVICDLKAGSSEFKANLGSKKLAQGILPGGWGRIAEFKASLGYLEIGQP